MKLELDFTNKVIIVVGKGTVKEFMEIINTPNFEDWSIDAQNEFIPYYPSYPYYSPYPTGEMVITTASGCNCSDKCNAE